MAISVITGARKIIWKICIGNPVVCFLYRKTGFQQTMTMRGINIAALCIVLLSISTKASSLRSIKQWGSITYSNPSPSTKKMDVLLYPDALTKNGNTIEKSFDIFIALDPRQSVQTPISYSVTSSKSVKNIYFLKGFA